MSAQNSLGVVAHEASNRATDYLYRVSIKCLIQNEKGEVLVVKETGRDYWDLPGGGMDHGETIHDAISREMREEASMRGDFTYQIVEADESAYLSSHDFWQIRLIFRVYPSILEFSAGEDADQVAFMDPDFFRSSPLEIDRKICAYVTLSI